MQTDQNLWAKEEIRCLCRISALALVSALDSASAILPLTRGDWSVLSKKGPGSPGVLQRMLAFGSHDQTTCSQGHE